MAKVAKHIVNQLFIRVVALEFLEAISVFVESFCNWQGTGNDDGLVDANPLENHFVASSLTHCILAESGLSFVVLRRVPCGVDGTLPSANGRSMAPSFLLQIPESLSLCRRCI